MMCFMLRNNLPFPQARKKSKQIKGHEACVALSKGLKTEFKVVNLEQREASCSFRLPVGWGSSRCCRHWWSGDYSLEAVILSTVSLTALYKLR